MRLVRDRISNTHGTLVGAFVTNTGIVLGADTAISGRAASGTRGAKTRQTGPRSVAALQGQYGMMHAGTGMRARLHPRFMAACDSLRKNAVGSLVQQSIDLANALTSELETFLNHVPADDVVPPRDEKRPDKHVNYIVIAGYDASGPAVVVQRLAMRRTAEGWLAGNHPSPALSFRRCGATFVGEDHVAHRLLTSDLAVKSLTSSTRHLRLAQLARKGDCSAFTTEHAREFYVDAVRGTVRIGVEFGIARGSVGGDLELYTISATGMSRAVMPEKIWRID